MHWKDGSFNDQTILLSSNAEQLRRLPVSIDAHLLQLHQLLARQQGWRESGLSIRWVLLAAGPSATDLGSMKHQRQRGPFSGAVSAVLASCSAAFHCSKAKGHTEEGWLADVTVPLIVEDCDLSGLRV